MSEIAAPLILTIVYLTLLGLSSRLPERSERIARIGRSPLVFALALGVYATSWTFYGSVGFVADNGYLFLAFHLGVVLACIAMPIIWRPLADLVRRHRLASTADLFAFRFQSQRIGALVTIFMLAGLLPYLALQMQAIGDAAAHLAADDPPEWLSLVYALVLSIFAVVVGARYAEPWTGRTGLLITLALESVVKVVALFIVAGLALFEVFDGPAGFADYLDRTPEALDHLFAPLRSGGWSALLLVAFAAAFLLPRQFHIAFVERPGPGSLRRAMWLLPLLLLLLNLPVPLLYAAGLVAAPAGTAPDMFVLAAAQSPTAQLAAFLGGVSASSAMILVTTIALSGMVVHHLILPLRGTRRLALPRLLALRRLVIAAIVFAGFAFYAAAPRTDTLIELGIVSFIAVLQLLPGVLATVYWPRATRRGVVSGLIGGIAVWLAFAALPLLSADAPTAVLDALGIEDAMGFSIWLSISVNAGLVVLGSLSSQPRPAERAAALACAGGPTSSPPTPSSADDLRGRLAARIGTADASDAVERALGELSLAEDEHRPLELRRLALRVQRNLSEEVGPLAARLVVGAPRPSDAREEAAALAAELRFIHDRALGTSDGAARSIDVVRRFYSGVLERLPVGLCTLDDSGEVLLWNAELARTSGVPESVAVGDRVEHLPAPWCTLLAADGAEDGGEDGERHATVAGKPAVFWVGRSILPASAGVEGGTVVVVEDLTEAHTLREQAAHQDRLASIGRLAAGVAHEILNPLTGIMMIAADLEDDPDATDTPNRLALITQEGQRIKTIVRALLGYSRSGNQTTEHAKLTRQPLRPVVEEALSLVRLDRRAKKLRWRVDVPADLTALIDRQRLGQVLINLLSNARDASPDHGEVAVVGRATDDEIQLDVLDQGAGIPAELHARIFEPFFTTKPSGEGTGLGLSLVHRMVTDHGGRVSYHRAPDGPTCLRVSLPRNLGRRS